MAVKPGNRSRRGSAARRGAASWRFLSNHAHVLLCIASDPTLRLREVAQRVGITERAVQRIVAHLVDAGYLSRSRSGRRNLYDVHAAMPLRDPLLADHQLKELLALVTDPRVWDAKPATAKKRSL
ncbi:MAG: helix-turn-helix transcriptional regulator [Pirellulales bacterium]